MFKTSNSIIYITYASLILTVLFSIAALIQPSCSFVMAALGFAILHFYIRLRTSLMVIEKLDAKLDKLEGVKS